MKRRIFLGQAAAIPWLLISRPARADGGARRPDEAGQPSERQAGMIGEPIRAAILIFDDVEVLDFAGPFEVFSATRLGEGANERRPFEVYTVAERPGPVKATGGLEVVPRYSFANAPEAKILVVPGGWGTRREVSNAPLIDWIAKASKAAELSSSVCTGAFLLAKAGLLSKKPATTHWASLDRMAADFPDVEVKRGVRFVESGQVATSAGVSAGIDMALRIVERYLGREVAETTARRMEYESRTWIR